MTAIQIEIFKFIFICASILGVWIAISLFIHKQGNQLTNRCFALFIALMVIPIGTAYLSLLYPELPLLIRALSHSMLWLYGPFMWLFLRLITKQPLALRNELVHLIPFVAGVLVKVLLSPTPQFWIITIAFVQVSVYLGLSLRLVVQHRQQLVLLYNGYQNTSYYWLLFLVIGIFALVVFDIAVISAYTLKHPVSQLTWSLVMVCISTYLIAIAGFSLFRPRIFFNQTEAVITNQQITTQTTADEPIDSTPSRRNLELATDTAQTLAELLAQRMQNDKLYLDNDLSLGKLAEQLGISSHQLSELLNIHLNTNFYEYLNNLRLEEAITLLTQSDYQMTSLELAYAAGFNNKNSFYRTFKDKTGTTPSEYRRQLPDDNSLSTRAA
jgi:AraC-like DNA-binding protein